MKYLYGIQPTGKIHLGNYLGGLKLAVEKKADILIANYHAMTSSESLEFYSQLKKLGIFARKQNIDALELAWKIQCITPVSDLLRMTQFKDKKKKNVGLLTYPCLMAADIILASPDYVIIGNDQLQHMEFYRRTCKRFKIKKIAKNLLTEYSCIKSIKNPEKKMSKSLGDDHCLYLGDDIENRKKIVKAPTTQEGIENLSQIAKGLGINYDQRNNQASKLSIVERLEKIKFDK